MYRYRHRYAESSCSKRDIQVKVWTFIFGSAFPAPFYHSDGVVLCTGAGLGQMRDALFRPTQARRTEMRLITTLLFPRQDLRKRADHQRISQKVWRMLFCVVVLVRPKSLFLSAPVSATSNDDGDVLSNRKRVCAVSHFASIMDHRLTRKCVSQPGSPLSSPTKIKKQKVSGTLIYSRMACPSFHYRYHHQFLLREPEA